MFEMVWPWTPRFDNAGRCRSIPRDGGAPARLGRARTSRVRCMCAFLRLKSPASKVVFVSTDKAVNPDNVYGVTKRIGELIVKCMW